MKSTLLKLLVALFTLSLIAAACGSDDDTADSGDSDALAEAEAALAAAEDAIEAAEAEAAEAQAAAEAAEAAASAGEDTNPLAGTAVRITGPVRSPDEVAGLMGALDAFAEANDMTIFYVGSADWESEINVQIEAGTPPDISIFPQPGKLADFARDGFVVPLPDEGWRTPANRSTPSRP
ncbi:MAG: extracellular solute-binding protein [Actinobacteria bacterium]|nr:extracellular solute-binding protein [Actinomycetota bacterium]